MDAGDSRKLGSFSGSTLTKKSMNFIRDAYSLAQTTFTEKLDGQQYPQQSAGLSQHFSNGPHNSSYPHSVANPYLQPSAALSPNPPQQWPRPPPSPNRPAQPFPTSSYQSVAPQRPHQVGTHYVPGQGMVSQPWGHDGRVPQRHSSKASADIYANLPPPPPYAPPQHSPSPPLPQQPAQQYPSQPATPEPSPAWTSQPPRPSVSPQPEQQGRWNNSPSFEHQQPIPTQQQMYQAFSPPTQQSQTNPQPPQRHQTLPAGQYRPYQYQPHHSNSYPATGLHHRPSISHTDSAPPPPLPDRPTPPLPQRPQWQAPHSTGYAELASPPPPPLPPSQQHQQHQPPAGYAELPSPPQKQQSYFPPPSGVAEMYAPPPPPPPPAAPTIYAELPGHESQAQQQPHKPAYQAYQGDVKPPIHQYHGQQGGHSIPHMAELPG